MADVCSGEGGKPTNIGEAEGDKPIGVLITFQRLTPSARDSRNRRPEDVNPNAVYAAHAGASAAPRKQPRRPEILDRVLEYYWLARAAATFAAIAAIRTAAPTPSCRDVPSCCQLDLRACHCLAAACAWDSPDTAKVLRAWPRDTWRWQR